MLALRRESPRLLAWTSPKDTLSILTTWKLASPYSGCSKWEPSRSYNDFYDLAIEVTPHNFRCIYWSRRPNLILWGRGRHKAVDTRNWEPLKAILKVGYHKWEKDFAKRRSPEFFVLWVWEKNKAGLALLVLDFFVFASCLHAADVHSTCSLSSNQLSTAGSASGARQSAWWGSDGRAWVSKPDWVPDLGHILYLSLSKMKLIFTCVLVLNWFPSSKCFLLTHHIPNCVFILKCHLYNSGKFKTSKWCTIDCLSKLWRGR